MTIKPLETASGFFDDKFPALEKCSVCQQWKLPSEFSVLISGGANTCKSCLKQQVSAKLPNLQLKWCESCKRFKNEIEFLGSSEVCIKCQTRKNLHEKVGIDLKGQYTTLDVTPAQKMCVHCNELKNKFEFATSASGESRLCKTCLQGYIPPEPEEPHPIPSWIVFIIGLVIGMVVL